MDQPGVAKCPFLHGEISRKESSERPAAVYSQEQPAPGQCPFGFGSAKPRVPEPAAHGSNVEGRCPFGFGAQAKSSGVSKEAADLSGSLDNLALDGHGLVEEQARIEGQSSEPKCPMGYDADTVKVGPLTCLVCKSLLFKTVRVLPCRHMFCNSCCLRLGSCGLCGGESKALEQDDETRMLDQNVRYFIEKFARRKREAPQNDAEATEKEAGQESAEARPAEVADRDSKSGDLSLEQGGLLLQLAMRAYAGRNNESAIHLLRLCEEDLRNALAEEGVSTKLLCQLGAVTAALGDFSRGSQDLEQAEAAYRDSAKWLELVEEKNAEVVHDLSVAYNKLGDLHYLAKRADEARKEYLRALQLRQSAHTTDATASEVLDLVVSFTKVADLDRASKKDKAALAHFREGAKLAAELGQKRDTYSGAIEQKRLSLLQFILTQVKELGEDV